MKKQEERRREKKKEEEREENEKKKEEEEEEKRKKDESWCEGTHTDKEMQPEYVSVWWWLWCRRKSAACLM